MGDGLGHTDREAISNTDAVSAPEQQADGSDNTGSASEQGNTEGASSVSSIAAGPSVVEGTHNGGECCSPEDEDSSCPPKKLCFERSPGSGRNNPSENMGDGLGHTDREAISNTDAVSAPEQQADGSDNTGSASEQGNTEGASSVSSIAAGPSVVEGTHNGGAPSGEEEHATQESTSQFPHGGDNNTAAPLSSCRRCRSPEDEDSSCPPKKPCFERSPGPSGEEEHATQESTSQFPHGGDNNFEAPLSSNRRCRSPEDEDSSCPPKKPCFERSPGSGSGVRNTQAGISFHDNDVEASLQPSVAEGCVQASLNGDSTPPPPEIINDAGVDGNGSNRHLENAARTLPPLRDNGTGVRNSVEQGDLQEDPEAEFFSYGDNEDYNSIFRDSEDSSSEDESNLFPENGFVHLPFGMNFQI
ncbi:dentin sialophosphoprotein-like isoform X3 [Macrobrachium nipponense]|uniref:dentin sialophosphoprotein-like isoform X3 n=1 Tax=Macrobrachium nipponense TaxID=159736 RepID=UPI0030C813D4